MRRRVLAMLLAGMLGVLGIVAVLAYVGSANSRALKGLTAVRVLVAESSIPAGTNVATAVREHQLGYEQFPEKALPADAVRSITHADTSLVTSSSLGPGQLLLQSSLVPKSQGATTLGIPTGKMAISISVCLAADVAGYVQPGAKVAVFNTGDAQAPLQSSCTSHEAPAKGSVQTSVVLPAVEVLSVVPAPSSPTSSGGSASSNPVSGTAGSASTTVLSQGLVLVTVAVDQSQAETLIKYSNSGELTLALLTPSSQVSVTGSTSAP